MNQASLFMVTVLVAEMDDAIAHFTHDWGFTLAEDTRHASGHRWVVLDPGEGAQMRLAEAKDEAEHHAIGKQTGTTVAFFLSITDFDEAIARWAQTAIKIVEPPRAESYGRVAVVQDKFGNRWDVFDKDYEPTI